MSEGVAIDPEKVLKIDIGSLDEDRHELYFLELNKARRELIKKNGTGPVNVPVEDRLKIIDKVRAMDDDQVSMAIEERRKEIPKKGPHEGLDPQKMEKEYAQRGQFSGIELSQPQGDRD